MAAIRINGSIRDWLNARNLRRMVRKGRFPEMVERHYVDLAEYGKDEAGLQALGYMVIAKKQTAPYVGYTLPASANGLTGHLDRRVQRRVASIHVLYSRRPEQGAEPSDHSAETATP